MNSVYRDDELISQIGSVGLPPFGGKRTFGYLPAGKTRSLSEVKLPIHIISGVRPGPTVLVQFQRSNHEDNYPDIHHHHLDFRIHRPSVIFARF